MRKQSYTNGQKTVLWSKELGPNRIRLPLGAGTLASASAESCPEWYWRGSTNRLVRLVRRIIQENIADCSHALGACVAITGQRFHRQNVGNVVLRKMRPHWENTILAELVCIIIRCTRISKPWLARHNARGRCGASRLTALSTISAQNYARVHPKSIQYRPSICRA